MLKWLTRFHTLRPMTSWPRLQSASCEIQSSPDYHHEGRFRLGEKHCIFKYTLRGEGIFRDRRGEHRVGRGMGFLCEIRNPETAYYYPDDGEREWEFVYIAFDGKRSRDMVSELVNRYGPLYHLPPDGRVQKIMEGCRSSDDLPREITAAQGAAVVMEVLFALGQSREGRQANSPRAELVRRARRGVEAHLERNINAGDLARMLDVSREHLSRVFHEETGTPIYEYIQHEKMVLACHLLQDKSLSAKEVAKRLGFDAYPHFSRAFRRFIGMPPRQFRKVGSVPVV